MTLWTHLRLLTVSGLVAGSAPAQDILYEFYGSTGDLLGSVVCAAGDVNQDGYDDFIIGSAKGAGGLGSAEVRSGFDGSLLHWYTGQAVDDRFGSRASAVGDANGDQVPDFAISAYGDATNGNKAGAIYLFSGKDGSQLNVFYGESDWEFGIALAGAGDVDNDGCDDLIAGSKTGPTLTGLARVYSGKTGAILHEFLGDNYQDWFGSAVDGAGDLDNDGHDDLLIGAWGADPGGDRSGQVRVYSGFDGSILLELNGTVPVGLFGQAVTSVGDVTSDACPDIAVGSPNEDGIYNNAGWVRVFDGCNGNLLYSVEGRKGEDRFGLALDGGMDVSGDGIPDWIGGGPAKPNSGLSAARLYDGETGILLFELTSDTVGEAFGAAVGLLGDLNGSGTSEVGVGGYNVGVGGVARAYAVNCTFGPISYCAVNANSTGLPALIETSGSQSVAANDFTLTVAGGIANQFGLFIYAQDQTQVPFGDGFLCLSPGSTGILRLMPPVKFDAAGAAAHWVDFMSPPANAGPGHIITGSTWNFQCWYRDPGGPGGSGFNMSDALSVTFCP